MARVGGNIDDGGDSVILLGAYRATERKRKPETIELSFRHDSGLLLPFFPFFNSRFADSIFVSIIFFFFFSFFFSFLCFFNFFYIRSTENRFAEGLNSLGAFLIVSLIHPLVAYPSCRAINLHFFSRKSSPVRIPDTPPPRCSILLSMNL